MNESSLLDDGDSRNPRRQSNFNFEHCHKRNNQLTLPLLLLTSLVELFPPELDASSSDKDSRLSVDWPLIIRILGDNFSSWKLFSFGWILFLGEVTNFPPAVKSSSVSEKKSGKWYSFVWSRIWKSKTCVTQKALRNKMWMRRKHEIIQQHVRNCYQKIIFDICSKIRYKIAMVEWSFHSTFCRMEWKQNVVANRFSF